MNGPLRNLLRAAVSLAILTLLSACAHQALDLNAINGFSSTAAASEQSFADIAADFYASCVRSHQFVYTSGPVPDPDCSESQADSKSWSDANEIVISYIKALGDLAGGTATTSDYGLPALSSQLSTSKILNDPQAQAIKTFATDAVNVIFAAERREVLADKMQHADGSLKTAIDTLKAVASHYSNTQLGFEQDQLNSFFQHNLVHPKKLGLQQIQLFEYRSDYGKLRIELNNRLNAAKAYASALDTIGQTHTQLLQSVQTHNLGSAIAAEAAAIKQIAPDLIALQKAFHR